MMFMMSSERSHHQSLLIVALIATLLFLHPLLQGKSAMAVEIRCKESEREALLEFKQSLQVVYQLVPGGISWWGTADGRNDCCWWPGVYCNNLTGYVEKIDLNSHFWLAEGTISPSLLKLKHLSYLDLSRNDFNGSLIPDFIGSLTNLSYLDLSYTNLRGVIPSQLGNLSKLETLCMGGDVFNVGYIFYTGRQSSSSSYFRHHFGKIFSVGNLEWVSKLSSLRKLDLRFTNLSKAGDWSQVVNQLPFLEFLNLNDCDLPGTISSSLSLVNSSSSLNSLSLAGNNLTSVAVFPWLFNVSRSLTFLDLSSNMLKGPLPDSFDNMDALVELYLGYNQLEGEIPRSFWSMCSLGLLNMESNHLSGLEFVSNTSLCPAGYSLGDLRLANNLLTITVLNELANLSSLTALDLGYNRLNGTISESIGQLSNLLVLRLAGNSFDGVDISEAHFSNLANLWKLDLSYTSLTLKFNSSWIPPFHLHNIQLRSCKLGPHFPEWIWTQNSVLALDLSASEISDSIPYWFWDSYHRVEYLNLSFNQISGTLPNDSIQINHLDLSANNFSGPLPMVLTLLHSLNLSKNKFFGSISSICNFINKDPLKLIDLSDNLFSGSLPDCFSQFPNLTALNLANNNFSGPIPTSLGSLASIEMLSFRGNRLSGALPSSLQNCTKLKFMDLSNNSLSGNIPLWIGENLSSLVFLSLQTNQFKGKIPYQLCGLKYVQILDLSVNKITGSIPHCLSNFTSMAQKLDLDESIEHLLVVTTLLYEWSIHLNYVDEAFLMWKGTKQMYQKILGLLLVIDLSCNKLTGKIPEELTSLRELVALNLSRNSLIGEIPRNIGQLRRLEALDLSRNRLSGSIPTSMSELTFLGTLDVSYNYLSGKIPTGSQLQLFDPSAFSHNRGLCGPPVTPNCSIPVETPHGEDDFDDEFMKWFYVGMGLGFVVGFWGLCSALLLKRSWRHSYFRFLDMVNDWFYVTFHLQKARLKRRITKT